MDGEEGPADVCVIELGGTIGKITILFFFMWLDELFSILVRLKTTVTLQETLNQCHLLRLLGNSLTA